MKSLFVLLLPLFIQSTSTFAAEDALSAWFGSDSFLIYRLGRRLTLREKGPRRVSKSELTEVARAVDLLYPDLDSDRRQLLIDRDKDFLAKYEWNRVESLQPVIDGMADRTAAEIGRAMDAKIQADEVRMKTSVVSAVQSIEFAARAIGAGKDIKAFNRAFTRVVLVSGLGSVAGSIVFLGHALVTPNFKDMLAFTVLLPSGTALTLLSTLGSDLTITSPAPMQRLRRALAPSSSPELLAQFWSGVEQALVKRTEWQDWVRDRGPRAGAASIADDVAQFLVHLSEGESLRSVCGDRLWDERRFGRGLDLNVR